MVGAGAVVTHDVPAHALVAGNPGPPDRLGLRLRGAPRRLDRPSRAGDGETRTRATRSWSARTAIDATPTADDEETLRRAGPGHRTPGRRHDPRRATRHRAGGDRRRHRGPRERDARRRPASRRARGALGRVHRDQARDRGEQRHRRADVHLRGPRRSGRATRSSPSATRSTRPSARSCPPARRPVFVDIEPDTYVIDAAPDRGGHHAADTRDLPGPPVRPAGRHGHDRGHRRPPRAGGRRGRLPGARRRVPRPARSAASATARSACTAPRT